MSLVDINDVRKTQHDIFQNNIDWVAKQVQTINDLINGVDDDVDGSQLPAIQPMFLNGVAGFKIGGVNLIDPNTQQDNLYTYGYGYGVSNLRIAGELVELSDFQYMGVGSYLADSAYSQYRGSIQNIIEHLDDYIIIQQKQEIADKNIYFKPTNGDFHLGCYNQNIFITNAWDNTSAFPYGNSKHASDFNAWFGYYISTDGTIVSADNLDKLNAPNLYVLKNYPVITNNSNDILNQNYYINNSQNNQVYNTYNYTSSEGDTYNIMVGGGGDGLGGSIIIPFAGGMLNYVDIENMFKLAIDDLNVSLDWSSDGLEPLYFPSYDEVKYEDQGSFYIQPIHQLAPLPAAPDVADTVIDVSEPLSILSTGFGSLLSCFDSLGVTLTLTFTFLACLVINKLRGD